MRNIIRTIVHTLLPKSVKPRKLRFGLAKGAVVNIDFSRDTAFYFGKHESMLHPHYRRLLKRGMRSFDVGMYRGWDAMLFAHLTGGEVVSFDGNPECLQWTAQFLAPSGYKVHLQEGYLTDGADGNSTLDQAATKYFVPDFIKMDVEGAEALVLGGAKRILTERHPSLVIEVHGPEVEAKCRAILHGYGYEPVTVERKRSTLGESVGMGHNRWLVCEGRPMTQPAATAAASMAAA